MLVQNGGLAFVAQQNSIPIKLSSAVILVFNGYDSCQGAEGLCYALNILITPTGTQNKICVS